ncbi:4-(cytidine 5'-diphospho)-2-C-methyl-D-erythritol kinase [Geobacter sulfurreducens]|uniref:4-diphosphocytidyl-2-C-methyl-D-erythritol kinase n=1 Tax=Geobacter sulfurreducens (strain ATCC 51573 / DSM 12127 / PCA) TaxID=243231 RepID=ISPE_GEOSL|nr:4-(cytidine 5'-diphospho)-2-C-methyl-D-erythritol kinase [Geobacter sulfurreducens]Q74FE9.1 RecName: Full=4-diphosphocytidyl-2-C-methyl-D-erythritol kinase; Short=CMK; AltName: Full=4-(cytidine-5'-diphospho)-2-C-methyl-D-erythritol kinase [Geobacter sulfurreducens PCA]AAR33990.1 4-diphosphocytidyl-2-C-methyl-D-erythritol kinase [Geobacter sulfurreducens PCA]ADI83499.1 4-diphosphocytidyl-2-C-methyl-D-erythritol kinase [Geobacter sulfurreducens KN400]AJY70408.1 4-diphosphocytidyl-2C-methyl-D-e
MKKLTLKAPAKVNYRLDVLRRRPDGYHDLRMIMQRIDLCDEIEICLTDGPGIRVVCGREGVPDGPGNIAWRAADALLALSADKPGIDISITKKIPVAAGLGGGSSDAATVLMGVNELLGLDLPEKRLREIGVTLGADVPFFIFGRTALAEGIGEELTAIDRVPAAWIVVVNPNVPVSTAWVYQNLQLTGEAARVKIPRFFESVAEVCAILSNDLESVTIPRYPVIGEIKRELLAAGALGSLMSGSGPTVFALFEEEDAAVRAAEMMRARSWFAAAVRTI